MKVALIVIGIVAFVLIVLVILIGLRFARRGWQRFSGLERQRSSAKQARDSGTLRLKTAERYLVEAQRELASHSALVEAENVDRLRLQLSTLADRLRTATYGYTPLGSPNPVREAELAELQQRDSDTIEEAQLIVDIAAGVRTTAREGGTPDLTQLRTALDHLRTSIDHRRAVN